MINVITIHALPWENTVFDLTSQAHTVKLGGGGQHKGRKGVKPAPKAVTNTKGWRHRYGW